MISPLKDQSGEEIDKREVLKGYEYSRGQFLTFTADELKALDVENTKIVDLEKFVPAGNIDPVYLDSPYYVYPDGPIAAEALRVIGAAMAEAGVVGIGRLTLSRREMQQGKRNGVWTPLMIPVLASLAPADLLAAAAYLASLQP